MERKDTIEQKTGAAVLQKPIRVTVGEREYEVAPPSLATLILVSEAVSLLPRFVPDADKMVAQAYHYARDSKPLGDVLAILILGAKNLTGFQKSRVSTRKLFLGLFPYWKEQEVTTEVDLKEELSEYLLENMSPRQLNELITRLTENLEIGFFFGLTTFLSEINLLSPTKEQES